MSPVVRLLGIVVLGVALLTLPLFMRGQSESVGGVPPPLPVIGDTFVADYGSSTPVRVTPNDDAELLLVARKDVEPKQYLSFIMFDVTSLRGESITAATLQLRANRCETNDPDGVGAVEVREVLVDWTAHEVTSLNIPKIGRRTALAEYKSSPANEPFLMEWDLSQMTEAWAAGSPNRGLALTLHDSLGVHATCTFASSETGAPPQLVVGVEWPADVLPLLLPWLSK